MIDTSTRILLYSLTYGSIQVVVVVVYCDCGARPLINYGFLILFSSCVKPPATAVHSSIEIGTKVYLCVLKISSKTKRDSTQTKSSPYTDLFCGQTDSTLYSTPDQRSSLSSSVAAAQQYLLARETAKPANHKEH